MDPKNIESLNELSTIYADYLYDYDKAVELDFKILEINPDFSKIGLAEDLIKARRYKEGRKYSLLALNEPQDIAARCITRFLIVSSRPST